MAMTSRDDVEYKDRFGPTLMRKLEQPPKGPEYIFSYLPERCAGIDLGRRQTNA